VNDRWRAEFTVTELGHYVFTVEGWIDPFETWSRQFAKRVEAGQDVTQELEVAARLVESAAARASGPEAAKLMAYAAQLRKGKAAAAAALASDLAELMDRKPLGHRVRGGRAQVSPPAAGDAGRFPPPAQGRWRARAVDRAGHRIPVLARPSLYERASRVVSPSPRRFDPVRREPAQEIRG